MTNPFHLNNLVPPALDGIIHALSDRPGLTDAQKEVRANESLALILSFLPRDAIDLTLSGQTVLFNELIADGARELLRGTPEAFRPRSRQSLISMGRILQGFVTQLDKRGLEPHRTETAAPRKKSPPVTAKAAPEAPVAPPAEAPVAEPTWLDPPFEQWVVETPADLASKAEQEARDDQTAPPKPVPAAAKPARPRQPDGYLANRKPPGQELPGQELSGQELPGQELPSQELIDKVTAALEMLPLA